eukprot:XP_002587562.1 hypothetical protein BRAFLDRAFT_95704 [Branchiostoma floridae]
MVLALAEMKRCMTKQELHAKDHYHLLQNHTVNDSDSDSDDNSVTTFSSSESSTGSRTSESMPSLATPSEDSDSDSDDNSIITISSDSVITISDDDDNSDGMSM